MQPAETAKLNANGRTPVVGVTGPDRGGLAAWWMTRLALRRAGAQALRITPNRPADPEQLDGLVLGGGADLAQGPEQPEAPPTVRERPPLWTRAISVLLAPLLFVVRAVLSMFTQTGASEDQDRDRLELRLLAYAARRDLPVLGICRGAQLMNLAEGGSLLWNVRTFYVERPELRTTLPRREVNITPGSRLAKTLGVERAKVNSLHSHAVDKPGKRLRIVARESSGVNQAIEHEARRFWIGVQWHPEYLPQLPVQQRLFTELVSSAARHRAGRQAWRRQVQRARAPELRRATREALSPGK